MKIFKIFQRQKPVVSMPEPMFEDNWRQDHFNENIKNGIKSLQEGRDVMIYDDGRGYELALAIKNGFILAYQKQLAEKISIKGSSEILISIKR